MGSDSKWLDQGKLFKGECPGWMQIGSGQHRKFAQSPINMHPKDLQIDATIRLAPQTGWTGPAREIWAYCAEIAFHKIACFCSDIHYFNSEFVTKNPWIRKEWLIAMKGVVVSSTDTYLPDANKCLCRSGYRWIGKRNHAYLTRSIKAKRSHLRSFLCLQFPLLLAAQPTHREGTCKSVAPRG
jgi:hypothetical protein